MAQPPVARPINTSQWRLADQNKRIDKFVATAVKMRRVHPENPARRLIHWRGGGAYLFGTDYRSTSFDTCKIDDGDPVVEVQFISKPFAVSSHAPYFWESKLLRDFTTTDVYNLILARGFNRFFFNGQGSGCQYWTKALVQLLENNNVLPRGSANKFQEKIDEVKADPEFWVPDEPGATFF